MSENGVRIEAASLTAARSVAAEIFSSPPEPPAPTEPVEVYVDGEIVYAGDVAGLLALETP